MRQNRSLSGPKFEKEVCGKFGWTHSTKSPRIKWNSHGETNLDKMSYCYWMNIPLRVSEDSNFEKYDAINENGDKIEIKKYDSTNCLNWTLYSEPLIKIASRGNIDTVTELFGKGDQELGRRLYNLMLEKTFNQNKDILLENIIKSNIGIQFKDKFVSKDNLEFRMVIVENAWRGYNRATIQFRVKDNNEIEETPTKKTFLQWILSKF